MKPFDNKIYLGSLAAVIIITIVIIGWWFYAVQASRTVLNQPVVQDNSILQTVNTDGLSKLNIPAQ